MKMRVLLTAKSPIQSALLNEICSISSSYLCIRVLFLLEKYVYDLIARRLYTGAVHSTPTQCNEIISEVRGNSFIGRAIRPLWRPGQCRIGFLGDHNSVPRESPHGLRGCVR